MQISQFVDHATEPPVRGFLHLPQNPNGHGLALTHGAGGNANAPFLVALAETFAAVGFTILRLNLPYRQQRSFGPPRPGDAARDRAGIKNAVEALRKLLDTPQATPGPSLTSARPGENVAPSQRKVFLSGHSYGGRQSSILCSEESNLVSGLLLCSYPLHPPGKPDQLRTQHFPNLRTSTLFVHGTRDPFGSIDEIEQALKLIPSPTELLVVQNAGHDLGFKGKGKHDGQLPGRVLAAFTQFFGMSSGAEPAEPGASFG